VQAGSSSTVANISPQDVLHETAKAESCLAAYIAQKYQPSRQPHDIDEISLADVISIYVDDRKLQESEGANKLFARLERLNEFWGAKKLAEVNGETCRDYARQCGSDGAARRDLEERPSTTTPKKAIIAASYVSCYRPKANRAIGGFRVRRRRT
jgi:hypothetical protein